VQISKEVKVATLVIFGIVVLCFGVNFLKGSRFGAIDPEYHAYYSNVESLYKSSKVNINGVQVGTVTGIEFADPSQLGKIKVTVQLNGKFPIPKDSRMVLYSPSMLGSKEVKIELGTDKAVAESGMELKSSSDNGMISSIGDQVGPLATNADKLLANANTLFDEKQKGNLVVTINNLNMVLANLQTTVGKVNGILDNNDEKIGKSFDNLSSFTGNLEKKNTEISGMINNLNALSLQLKDANLPQTVVKLNSAIDGLNNTLKAVNSNEGTLGKLINDPTLHNKLAETINSANALVVDMKANPKRYISISVFGGKKE
jgi:phospholipid/cholesterol/gamma-HCH transport system substrate-binding protein